MLQKREHPYIWATWLPRLLTGENSCEWAAWFKAHHKNWNRAPSDFDQARWLMLHTALLNEQREQWEAEGYQVYVEGQNKFEVRGKSAKLSGKADIIARREDEVVIIDTKTGQESASHIAQVMIYMYTIPMALAMYRDRKIIGQVAYRNRAVNIPAEEVDDRFKESLNKLILRIASDTPARKVPNPQECRFCDIGAAYCPERVDGFSQEDEGSTVDF